MDLREGLKNRKICAVDIETTGLSPDKGAVVLSIGAVCAYPPDYSQTSEYYGVLKPSMEEWVMASEKALEINGFTWDIVEKEGKPFLTIMADFTEWLNKNETHKEPMPIFIGQNPAFDTKFLKFYMNRFLGGYIALDRFTDVRDVYKYLVSHGKVPSLPYYSGKNISLAVNVEPEDEVHNALEGAKVVLRNFLRLVEIGSGEYTLGEFKIGEQNVR